jgi:hypothetical protein
MFGCAYVGFAGSGRVVGWGCYDRSSDAAQVIVLPGTVAATGIILIGAALLYWWWVRPFRMARRLNDAELYQSVPSLRPGQSRTAERLEELERLRDAQVITDQEYQTMRQQILDEV